ncbi:MAG: YifB family Mg chelatase-like AAA ATPase [Rickettsiaceae bacterium]|nr:YifB family Mg chelatase-like AAA ATPase [Rickettsiaceae bacterium]
MVVHVSSAAFSGVETINIDVQVHMSPGIPQFTIVGLGDKAIAESRERVKAAIVSMGLSMPSSKILVNLAPADLAKEGSHYDLPIALGVLGSMNIISKAEIAEYLVLGELSLDGSILPVTGILPAAISANALGLGLICPKQNGKEAAWSGNKKIIAAKHLLSIINHFKGVQVIDLPDIGLLENNQPNPREKEKVDFADIVGQDKAKKALEIAASGGHNVLMFGPPGTGKSMLASRMPTILPEMEVEQILETSVIYSISGLIQDGMLQNIRPFRAPHHSCSVAAMVGGGVGKKVKPGEISLAHNGVLFLDELPEFPPVVIESLRQPIENREVLISRSNSHIKFPANFQLIAAMNRCKCGFYPDPTKSCSKAPVCASEYVNRISGPMLDRFDIHTEVGSIDAVNFNVFSQKKGESSADIYERVKKARDIQSERFEGYNIKTNSQMYGSLIVDFATPDEEGLKILNEAASKFKFSMRTYNKILKVARTIADLDESKQVRKVHVAEAIFYRNPDRL